MPHAAGTATRDRRRFARPRAFTVRRGAPGAHPLAWHALAPPPRPPGRWLRCASRKGAEDQRMRDPSEELSVRLGSRPDGSMGRPVGSKLRLNPDWVGGATAWAVTRVNVEQASKVKTRRRASNEGAKAVAGRAVTPLTEASDPAAGVMTTARAEGSLCNVRGPTDRRRATGGERRGRRRIGRESDRPIVPKGRRSPRRRRPRRRSLPVTRVTTAEGRGLTSGVLAREATVVGDWR